MFRKRQNKLAFLMSQVESVMPKSPAPVRIAPRVSPARKVEFCNNHRPKKKVMRDQGHFDRGHSLSLSVESDSHAAISLSIDATERELDFGSAEGLSGEMGMQTLMDHSVTRDGTTTRRSIRKGDQGTEYRKSKVSASEDSNPEGDTSALAEKDGEFDLDFEEDLEKILSPISDKAQSEDEEEEEEVAQAQSTLPPPPPKEKLPEGHSLFEKMSSGMEYATTFDLGTVDLSEAFDQFDSAMEVKEMTAPPLAKDRDPGTEEFAEMFSQFDEEIEESQASAPYVEAEEVSSAQSKGEAKIEQVNLDLRPKFPPDGPKSKGAMGSYDPETGKYQLKDGDTLYRIAIRFGTDVPTIMEANKLINPRKLPKTGSLQINYPRYGTMDWRKALNLKDPESIVIDPDKMDAGSLAKANIDVQMSMIDNRLAALENFETVLTAASLKDAKQKGLGAIALAEGSKLLVEYITGRISTELKETVKFLRNTANAWDNEKARARQALGSYNLAQFVVDLKDQLINVKTALRNSREQAASIADQTFEAYSGSQQDAYLEELKAEYRTLQNDFNGYYSIPVQFQLIGEAWVNLWYVPGKTQGLAHIEINREWQVTKCDLKVPGGQKLAEQLMAYARKENNGTFDLASFEVERQLAFYSGHYVRVNRYGTAYQMSHHGFALRGEWGRIASELVEVGIPPTRMMSGSN